MASILLGFDGTWDKPGDENNPEEKLTGTNVVRLCESARKFTVDQNGQPQKVQYFAGLGTKWYEHFRGGLFGYGLDATILEGYRCLIKEYQDGDEVYVIGFSRGAYTARSLSGLIRKSGLLRKEDDALIDEAYTLYRAREDDVDSERARAFRKKNSRDITIKFMGVWDTVGELGIPLKSFADFDAALYGFHDTKLSSIVQYAYHVLAIDENREPFSPTCWGPQDPKAVAFGQKIEQVWVSGAHADIGGGYQGNNPISDLTLCWMQQKAARCGLQLEKIVPPKPDLLSQANIHDSFKEFFSSVYSWFHSRYYRPIGQPEDGSQVIDLSVIDRLQNRTDYRPKNKGLYEKVGDKASIVDDVYARNIG